MRIVVTAGPTREPLDPVRFISNRSSGKMGYAIAAAARARRHEVTLISGPVGLKPPRVSHFISVTTNDDLFRALQTALRKCDVLVMCAAVADYKPVTNAKRKMPKRTGAFDLRLTPTRDILKSLPSRRSYFVVGFAAQTHELEKKARAKMRAKGCDMIIANDVSRTDSGMESDDNEVVIFFQNGAQKKIQHASKKIIARELVKIISREREKSFDKKNVVTTDRCK